MAVAAVVAALALLATPTMAQPAATLTAPGDSGIALSEDGKNRLHLGITAGAGFDTNPYSTPLAGNEFTGDIIARFRPYLEVNAPGSMLSFGGKAQLDYGFLPGVIDPETRSFLLYQSLLSGDIEVNRGGTFTFAVGDAVSWNSDPGVAVLGSLLNRVRNTLRAGVGFRPGGGTLTTRLGYRFDFTKFIDIQGNQGLIADGLLDSMRHGLTLRADYRFLPKTGVFGSVSAGWQSYPFTNTQPNAFPLTAMVGLQGNVMPKLAGLLSVGYSNPFVVDSTGLVTGTVVGVVGQAEAQWRPLPQTGLALGFQRSFDPIALYQYIGNNRVYADVSQTLGQFQLKLNGGYSALEFGAEQSGGVPITDRATGRFDHHIDGKVALNFYVTRWLSFGINNSTDYRITNAADASGATPLNLGFFRNETLVVASARY